VEYATPQEASGEQHNTEEYSPRSSIGSWVQNRDVRTAMTTDSLNAENSFRPATPSPLPAALGQIFGQTGTTFIDDEAPLVEESSDTEDVETLIDQLSDRVGTLRIGPGGETQFYGPTSTFNLVDTPLSQRSTAHSARWNDTQYCLDRLGINQQVPADLEE
jgi:hypothetical protein